ncbi:MAG: hypothetical protein ABGZ17_13390 [Planctomycetaceae bacterium]
MRQFSGQSHDCEIVVWHSDDEGRSFDYLLSGPYETVNAFLTRNDEFVVFTARSHRSGSLAGVYHWVPHRSPATPQRSSGKPKQTSSTSGHLDPGATSA